MKFHAEKDWATFDNHPKWPALTKSSWTTILLRDSIKQYKLIKWWIDTGSKLEYWDLWTYDWWHLQKAVLNFKLKQLWKGAAILYCTSIRTETVDYKSEYFEGSTKYFWCKDRKHI